MTSDVESKDFIEFLKNELEKRRLKNRRYSLRAYAKALQIHHGALSLILRKKRSLTREMTRSLGQGLNLPSETIDSFIENLPYDYQSFHRKRQKIKRMRQLSLKKFHQMSTWYYDAIIELTRTGDSKMDLNRVASRLEIPVEEVRDAIEVLSTLGILKEDPEKGYVEVLGDTTTTEDLAFTDEHLLRYQAEVLKKSSKSLSLPKTKREHSSMTMAIDKSDIAIAKTMIQSFCREMMSYLQREGVNYNEVYQLSVSLYPLTKTEPE